MNSSKRPSSRPTNEDPTTPTGRCRADPSGGLTELASGANVDLGALTEVMNQAQQREAKRLADVPDSGLGVALRSLSGAHEELINEFPSERTRYTAMGGVILGTGCIAAMSMWFAIANGLQEPPLVATVFALVWAVFIINLDRWLVSGVGGDQWYSALKYGLRMGMALVFALVIAEPFVLRLFQSAIETRVVNERLATNRQTEGLYRSCNPITGEKPADEAGCAGYVINIGGAPTGLQELARLTTQAAEMEKSLSADRETLNQLEATARAECTGAKRSDTTGEVGEGPECLRNRKEADDFRDTANLGARQTELDQRRTQIADVNKTQGDTTKTYEEKVTAAVKDKIEENKQDPHAQIGLLERFEALSALSSGDSFVKSAELGIRLLFVTIECLPILVKMISGSGPYEKAMRERMLAAGRVDSIRSKANESLAGLGPSIDVMRNRSTLVTAEMQLQSEDRVREANRQADITDEIERYRRRLMQGGKRPAPQQPPLGPDSPAPRAGRGFSRHDHEAPPPDRRHAELRRP